ncbi:uncharacterized protein LOC125233361 [Leguminivora glycinivorella]|uniref:uncharacterized protein LOC125233361 n=1 Tax=Leguminivora glycinivorella TaxID=1035111 RepID=UPI00200E56C6|nr:uncharacterized protein LOC125233361 [Leguminivora glycinivorella]
MVSRESRVNWSDGDILRLIKVLKKHVCIWNPDDELYGDRVHLAETWDKAAKTLGMPEDAIRIKWKNLRDCFKKEVKKNDVTTKDDYRGRWRYFKHLAFLLRSGEEGEEQIDTDSEPEEKEIEIEYETKYVPDADVEAYTLEEDPIPEKRFKRDDVDFDMMFLKSLTPFLRQLEPTRNLVIRSRMQDMLLNEIAAQNMGRRNL